MVRDAETATVPEPWSIVEALRAVMADVQAIGKNQRNEQQGFAFRGVDAVVNVVGPVLRAHGVIVLPVAQTIESERYETKSKTAMRGVTVKIAWRFYGPAGDHVEACTYGEAADSGDKAVAKAQSVAYRVALLQALCIPTGDRDPDADVHERAGYSEPEDTRNLTAPQLRYLIGEQGKRIGWTLDETGEDFAATHASRSIVDADVETLNAYLKRLTGLPSAPEPDHGDYA